MRPYQAPNSGDNNLNNNNESQNSKHLEKKRGSTDLTKKSLAELERDVEHCGEKDTIKLSTCDVSFKDEGEEIVDIEKKDSLFNLHVFTNKSFLVLCLNNFFFTFGLSIIYVHLSAYAGSMGFSDDQGAMLFSALGIANFVGGRLSVTLPRSCFAA